MGEVKVMKKYELDYDDPYAFLAFFFIARLPKADMKRALEDDEFVYHLLVKEVRGQDFQGPFLDALITTIIEDKQRMELMHQLDKLADYFWTKLDLDRLREKISSEAEKYHIM